MAPTRDYYGDLELPPSADVVEVKKQFRKLALRYHPDRNPGREQEVNSKFQIIQSAHEILSDPQQKAKYDATLGQPGRMGGASGVKGNPWQNVSQQFPTPPRRNTTARNATSGAQRWQSRFSNGVPPTAKQQAAADPEAKKNAARAFENMRKNQSQGSARSTQRETRPSQPPPPPPRTESARQRAQASFGARKTGFHPRSADPGDEPPVSSQSYYTRPSPEPPQAPEPPPRKPHPTAVPDPLSQFRDRDGYMADTRQATPYSSHGGEKTNPFDGVPLGRAKSSRESYRRDEPPALDDGFPREQMHRSSSVPKSTSKEGAGSGQNVPREDSGRPYPSDETPDEYTDTSFKSRTNAKYNSEAARDPTAYAGHVPNTEKYTKSQDYSGDGPSMYDIPRYEQPSSRSDSAAYGINQTDCFDSIWQAIHDYDMAYLYGSSKEFASKLAPSGSQNTPHFLSHFERQQHLVLDRLISNIGASMQPERKRAHHADSTLDNCNVQEFADRPCTDSFNFPIGDDAFEHTSPSTDPSRFSKSSVDDINTQFVNDDGSNTWQFSAGNSAQDGNQAGRPPSGGRANRRSPLKRPTMQRTESANAQPQSEASSSAFNANGWSDKFGPQTFVPQPTPGASASPTRSSRTSSKKVKAKPTVGNAAIIDDSSSDDETYDWRGRNAQSKSSGAESPQAMDIDSPPSASTVPPIQPGSARNIHVEPSRPEWRPGNVDAMTGDAGPERPEKMPINSNAGGSEDSEEFKASFADLKNVAPFAQQNQQKVGLGSFADLEDNLPFESKASEELPIKLPKAQPLVFPTAPEAPRLPPTVAIEGMKPNIASWSKYLAEFESYLQQWDDFNGQVVDHFATRKAHIAQTRSSKGYAFLGARGDGDIQEYYNWVQQDNDVRQRWNATYEEHEQRFREFMAFRERMK